MYFDANKTACAVFPCMNNTALIILGAAMAASVFARIIILPEAEFYRDGTSGFAQCVA